MENINNAYSEVLVILRNMNNGFYTIPYDVLQKLKRECNLNHKFKLKDNVPLNKQNLLLETKAILAIFYRDYWANDEQYKFILEKEKNDEVLLEQMKRDKYNPNDIFSKSTINEQNDGNQLNEKEQQLIKVNDSIFVKIKKMIFKIFHLN